MEKQLIPQLRFPGFEDNWSKVIISKIADKITDGTHDTPKPIKEGIPFLTAIHVKDGRIDFDNCYYLSKEEHNKIYKRCNPEFGDLLMVNIGAGTATSAMVNVNYEFSLKNVALIKPNKTKIYPSFFAQVQRKNSDRLRHQISSGGAQPFLSLKAIGKLKLNIPTLPEQQKIASFLTEVDTKITKLTKKKALLEQYKKGIMQKIFNQELRFKDDEGNAFPNWEEKKLSHFKGLVSGDGDWILSKDISRNGEYEIVQLGNIGFGFYVEKKLKTITSDKFIELKGTLINKGDLLINRMVDGALNCCILNKNGNYITSVDVCWIRENKYFNNYFFMSLLLFGKNQNKLLNLSSGSGRVRISKRNLYNEFSFKLPSAEEQTKIANFLSDIDLKIEALDTKIENSKAFKKGLLQQMFV